MLARERFSRERSILCSRVVIVLGTAVSLGAYFVPLGAVWIVFEILLRTYVHFVLGGMAHEASHGHLGHSRRANFGWGRLALLATTVPSVTFRKTHVLHHAHTNDPERDPDAFVHTRHAWQLPLRAVLMPHQWLVWLLRRGRFTRADAVEYVLTYGVYLAVFGAIAYAVGPVRLLAGLVPAAILHSLLLWYPFAVQTHAGFRMGAAEQRSHDYVSRGLFWLTFGLSLHRVHHLQPQLAWLEMARTLDATTVRRWTLRRDVRVAQREAGPARIAGAPL